MGGTRQTGEGMATSCQAALVNRSAGDPTAMPDRRLRGGAQYGDARWCYQPTLRRRLA